MAETSKWDSDLWDAGVWQGQTVPELLLQAPTVGRGYLIGVGDWRLVVEALLPADSESLWGRGTWANAGVGAEWGQADWLDLSPWVRGLDWQRGADEAYGRARVGEMTVTLDANDDRFDPWNPEPPIGGVNYFAPGTLVRVGIRSATETRANGWIPQFAGIVDRWGLTYADDRGTDRFVDVTCYETVRDLAQIDDNALVSAVGSGEGTNARFERLLDAAGWQYGYHCEAQNLLLSSTAYPVQATDMAANRLTECYVTADSADVTFRSDRYGRAVATNVEYAGQDFGSGPVAPDPEFFPLVDFSYFTLSGRALPWIGFGPYYDTDAAGNILFAPYQPSSFVSAPDDRNLINDARIARVGGTQQVFEQLESIAKYGRRTLVRNDLVTTVDSVALQYAQYTTVRRGLTVLRVNAVEVMTTDLTDPDYALAVLAADIGCYVSVLPPSWAASGDPYLTGLLTTMRHRVTPRNGSSVSWSSTFGFDTRNVYNLLGATVPSTQP